MYLLRSKSYMGNPSAIILQKIKTVSSYNGGLYVIRATRYFDRSTALFGEMVPHFSLSKLTLKWNFIVMTNKPTNNQKIIYWESTGEKNYPLRNT